MAWLENDPEVNRIFDASYPQLVVSLVAFVLFPVAMPRELFYRADTSSWADAFWYWFDAPDSCLPSLLASNCLLLSFLHARRSRVWIWTERGWER